MHNLRSNDDCQAQEDGIRAAVERVTFRNEQNGWSVLRLKALGGESVVTATGHFPPISSGEHFEFFGEWTKHPQYGRQLLVARCVPIRPKTEKEIATYLASGVISGIGPKTAQKIVSHFKEDTLNIMDTDGGRLKEVPTIGKKKLDTIIHAWQQQRGMGDLLMFLSTHGISQSFGARIFKKYGQETISILSKNPYRLAMDIRGIGFVKADVIAQRMGIKPDSVERVKAATLYVLKQHEDQGHCYMTIPQITVSLSRSLTLDPELLAPILAEALTILESIGGIFTNRDADETLIYSQEIFLAEFNIVEKLKSLLDKPFKVDTARVDIWLSKYSSLVSTPLSVEQIKACRTAVLSKVFILTGGPGVGKTTTANAIIRLAKAMGQSVALAAPTGRAAQRLSEVSALPAKTIHRLLEWQPPHGFQRHEEAQLDAQTIIIDEASMLDVRLAHALLNALPNKAQIIFIGDVDQLPSVGPGNVLRDLIHSQAIPVCRLSEIFRQAKASHIVLSAHEINRGIFPESLEGNVESSKDLALLDCLFFEESTGSGIKDRAMQLIAKTLPDALGLDPIRDIQVLTPMNVGELGTHALNSELQLLLNDRRDKTFARGGTDFRLGDKVIQVANNYDLAVFNGDIGYIVSAHGDRDKLIVDYGGRHVTYDKEQALDLKLAYAITIHKSQGSEFPVVVIPCTMQHFVMLQRNLFYTALTRAKKCAVFIGARKALRAAIANQKSDLRQTRLKEKLQSAFSDGTHYVV